MTTTDVAPFQPGDKVRHKVEGWTATVERVRPLDIDWMIVLDKTPFGTSLNDVAFYADALASIDSEECPPSKRVDGKKHSFRFDGDDLYAVCVYCNERRDALSGRVLPIGS